MSKLPQALDIPVWGVTGRSLHFERTEDVIRWSEEEIKHWTFDRKPQNQALLRPIDEQCNALTQVANWARQLEPLLQTPEPVSMDVRQRITQASNNLFSTLNLITGGSLLTSEHPTFRFIAGLVKYDPDAAAILLMASRSSARQVISSLGHNLPFEALARMPVSISLMDQGKDIEAYKGSLASMNNDAEKTLASLRTTLEQEVSRSQGIAQEHSSRVEKQDEEWDDLLKRCQKEWDGLKDVYDTQLGLRAPSEYWTNRGKQYRTLSWRFAWGFLGSLALFLGLFVHFGIPALKPQPLQSTWVTILPVVIPAFAGLWILRILGRQLSESLAIMKDAQERVTLVTTFLALMRDASAGKAVAKDEDRALILSALFRQSRVTAVDDSPPINVFDAVLKARGT